MFVKETDISIFRQFCLTGRPPFPKVFYEFRVTVSLPCDRVGSAGHPLTVLAGRFMTILVACPAGHESRSCRIAELQ